MDSDSKAAIDSISSCISVLLGDLQQPGTPAIVLKLASSWENLKLYLPPGEASLQLSTEQEENVQTDSSEGTLLQMEDTSCAENRVQAPAAQDVATSADSSDTEAFPMATQLTTNSENSGQGLATESSETESSGLLLTITR